MTHPLHLDTTPIQLKNGYAMLPCEQVSDALAIIPVASYSDAGKLRFTGRFTVAASNGYSIPNSGCPTCARATAAKLDEIAVDWSDVDVMKTITAHQGEQIRTAMIPIGMCQCLGTCSEAHCCEDHDGEDNL